VARNTKDPEALAPTLPEDLTEMSDEDLASLLKEHDVAATLIEEGDAEFTKGLEPEEILAQGEVVLAQMEAIVAEQNARVEGAKQFDEKIGTLAERRKALLGAEETPAEDEPAPEDDPAPEDEPDALAAAEVTPEDEPDDEPEVEEPKAKAKEELAPTAPVVRLRRSAPATPADRERGTTGAVLTAAAGVDGARSGAVISDPLDYARIVAKTAQRHGRVNHHAAGTEQRVLIASAAIPFPEERKLHPTDWDANADKIRKIVPGTIPGVPGYELTPEVLVASGGLCAPLEPIYSMPNFASEARPVRDALPSFQADRGGVNVPAATTIGDITSAITVIEESDDALGGTFATKSCQDLECPAYTETAVTIISHCREYGNLVAMSWPEKIAHENALTMAAHARSAETYLLDRIKLLSVNVTNGAETLGALIYLVDAIVKAKFGIMGRLRMDENARFRALIPFWVPDMLALDTVQTIDGNRFTSKGELVSYLRGLGIEPVFYLDSPSDGTTQLPDTSQAAGALEALPDNVQWAIYPEGAFIHVDMGTLELGLVRDSTLNSTNDHQLFGESFENVARLAPAQACYWVTSDLCAVGQFPPAGTARTCD